MPSSRDGAASTSCVIVVDGAALLLPGFGLLGAGLPGFAGALGGLSALGRGVAGGVRSGEWQGEGAPNAAAGIGDGAPSLGGPIIASVSGIGATASTASRAAAIAPPSFRAITGGTALPISTNARDHASSKRQVGGNVCSVAASRTVK